MYYMQGNMSENSVWSDINFRLAVAYGLDNEAIGKAASSPAATAMATPLWNTYYEAWSKEKTIINTYDKDLALEYLAKSPYAGEKITLLVYNDEIEKNAGTMILALLTDLGINAELTVVEQTQLEAKMAEDTGYDLYLSTGGGSSLIGGLNRLINNSDFADGYGPGRLNDPVLFEMYANTATVETCTLENMTKLQKYILDNVYLYVWGYNVNKFVYTSRIAEFKVDRDIMFSLGDCEYWLD